jgi:hypothetical protein
MAFARLLFLPPAKIRKLAACRLHTAAGAMAPDATTDTATDTTATTAATTTTTIFLLIVASAPAALPLTVRVMLALSVGVQVAARRVRVGELLTWVSTGLRPTLLLLEVLLLLHLTSITSLATTTIAPTCPVSFVVCVNAAAINVCCWSATRVATLRRVGAHLPVLLRNWVVRSLEAFLRRGCVNAAED